jgi:predicted MFS family arabinose efflux permease
LAVSLFIEPPLLLWAARRDRERVIASALVVQGAALIGAACGPNAWTLLLGVSVATLMISLVGCALLDEILLVFAGLHLRERCHFDAATTDLLLFALALGSVLGIALTERFIAGVAPRRLLAMSCALCIAVYLLWLQVDDALASAACLFVIGAAVGPQFPLAQAQSYRCANKEPLLVNLLETLLEPLHASLPLLVGWIADRFGLGWALGILLAQPALLLCALLTRSPDGH